MQSQFSIRCALARNSLMLVALMLSPGMISTHCAAQVSDTHLPAPLRTAHDFGEDYIHDKPFQYSPCDPFERGKIFRLHTGHWGHFYNCDAEEAKRCSPYIYWKMNDKPTLPGHLGPLEAIRCEYNQVKQRILDGSCAECPTCGQAGCAGCADSASNRCSTCNRAGCRGCGADQVPDNGGCADGSCGKCRECKLRALPRKVSSVTERNSCASGGCDGCPQCAIENEIPNAGSYLTSGCATGDCGRCAVCQRRARLLPAASQPASSCASGDCGQGSRRGRASQSAPPCASACASRDCGQCSECKSRGIFSKNCAKGACAPEGFRGPRTACAREGNCGCVDTTFDALAPAGLIYYVPAPRVSSNIMSDLDRSPGTSAEESPSRLPANNGSNRE